MKRKHVRRPKSLFGIHAKSGLPDLTLEEINQITNWPVHNQAESGETPMKMDVQRQRKAAKERGKPARRKQQRKLKLCGAFAHLPQYTLEDFMEVKSIWGRSSPRK